MLATAAVLFIFPSRKLRRQRRQQQQQQQQVVTSEHHMKQKQKTAEAFNNSSGGGSNTNSLTMSLGPLLLSGGGGQHGGGGAMKKKKKVKVKSKPTADKKPTGTIKKTQKKLKRRITSSPPKGRDNIAHTATANTPGPVNTKCKNGQNHPVINGARIFSRSETTTAKQDVPEAAEVGKTFVGTMDDDG
jgi:hypothetical protein